MIMLKRTITISIILISFTHLSAQRITGLGYNHAIMNALEEESHKITPKALTDTIIHFDTEFFEDFSTYHYEVFPRRNRWKDRYAFINSTYPDSMISLGVATLDALDQRGLPWYSEVNKVVPSDTLTSNDFEFDSEINQPVYFSFFYEPGGKGDIPEGIDTLNGQSGKGKDSLLLEFFNPGSAEWIYAFHTLDNRTPHNFTQVIVRVDTSFLKKGFKFRFRNYTSAELNNVQGQDLGKVTNNDHWHIDYIWMKVTADSTELSRLNDITVVKPLLPTLKSYTAVPYHHFFSAQVLSERTTIPFSFRTIYPGRSSSDIIQTIRFFRSYNLKNNEQPRDKELNNDLSPNAWYDFADNFTSGFEYDQHDTIGLFELEAFIKVESENQRLENDTARRKETYYDHYAYDDGSAEYSFGLSGEKQDLSRIAQRFRVYQPSDKPDSLWAVLIYFTKSVDSSTINAEFRLSIRKNDGPIPAKDEIYSSGNITYNPDYSRGLNGFTRIDINPPILITDTFFVVIEQLNGYVGIGYDINYNSSGNIFTYTLSGANYTWINNSSLRKGSLMIRPSFNSHDIITSAKQIETESVDMCLYPNPATTELKFASFGSHKLSSQIKVYNIMGVPIIDQQLSENRIDISALKKGMYILVLSDVEGLQQKIFKFIKE
jgi:hypothetical protein